MISLPTGAAYGQVLTPPDGYTGIYTAQDLSNMRDDLTGKYILMSDLDLTAFTAAGNGWTPVGTETAPFAGILDGNGHSVTGLRIYRSYLNTESFVGGLFGYAREGNAGLVPGMTDGVQAGLMAAGAYGAVAAAAKYEKPKRDARGRFVKQDE